MKTLLILYSEVHALVNEEFLPTSVFRTFDSSERYTTEGMYPYHIQLIQRLELADMRNRSELCCWVNRLTPNDPYMGRTIPLTSKRCILYIYSTNIGTEYFKHVLYSPFFFLFKMQFVS